MSLLLFNPQVFPCFFILCSRFSGAIFPPLLLLGLLLARRLFAALSRLLIWLLRAPFILICHSFLASTLTGEHFYGFVATLDSVFFENGGAQYFLTISHFLLFNFFVGFLDDELGETLDYGLLHQGILIGPPLIPPIIQLIITRLHHRHQTTPP